MENRFITRSLLDYWYPLFFSNELKHNETYSISLYGEPLVLFRTLDGKIQCLQDRCSHRSAPLSIGVVEKGELECRYHGWRFGAEGKCVRVPSFDPSSEIPSSFKVPHYPTHEKAGIVWVWIGNPDNISMSDEEFPGTDSGASANMVDVDSHWDTNYSFEVLMENSLDPSHLQFTHEGQQGAVVGPRKSDHPNSAVPRDLTSTPRGFTGKVIDETTKNSLDYDIRYEIPSYSEILLKNRNKEIIGHIRQWVVPLTREKTRLVARFKRSFATFLPTFIFQRANFGVVAQDLVVLVGQQMRIDQGAPRWNIPVKADILSIEFRKWWDKISEDQKIWFSRFQSTLQKPTVVRALVTDIEDLSRSKVNPCVPCGVFVEKDTIEHIKDKIPEYWPLQYPERKYKKWGAVFGVAVVIAAVAYKYYTM
eukprot:TRINITY_DN8038_c0_g1_i1.p1 TRINITY_DN8038_c0_g1~~TRINITY_DN8038_c0_g1_i1.p1  ORF type:complete len:421 (-),score=58.42 TRINITY_DN8038_c0_g1_i1:58-1320(-)